MKNKILVISLLFLSGALIASDMPTPQYEFSGEQAVRCLIRNGDCRDCDLSNQDLRAAMAEVNSKHRKRFVFPDFSGANLSGANLAGTDLSCATMRDTNLAGADLTNANLSNAIMTDVDLSGADLTNANLSGATMKNVNMTGADTTGTDMTHVGGLSTVIGYTATK
jgi:uncharacterized protein YjbI with pentapeptide repeats